jgi:flagellar basal-body rod protein FlgF
MDRMLYVAMSGASQTLLAQAANSHNLANSSTAGFRADLNQFRSQPVFGDGFATRVFAMSERPGVDFSPGAIHSTGRDLDVAINGEGWLAVQAPDGGEAYTRAGDLRISSSGLLETGAGHPVLGSGGAIGIPPAEKIEIGSDGTVSVRPVGQDANALTEVGRIKLVNPSTDQLIKGTDGLFRMAEGEQAQPDASIGLVSGSLESGNVDSVAAMVNMITLAWQFEMQVKMMRVAEEDDRAATQMMQMN